MSERAGALSKSVAPERSEERAPASGGRLRALIATAALLVAGAAAVTAIERMNAAQRERDSARSRGLAASSLRQLAIDPELGLLLAREAVRGTRTAESEAALRAALQSPIRATFHGPPASVAAIAVAGDRVAALGDDGKLLVWDARAERPLAVLPAPERPLRLEFSRDGRRLAIAGPDGLRVVPAPGRPVPPASPPTLFDAAGDLPLGVTGGGARPGIQDAVFVSGGRQVLTVGAGGTQLWNARSGQHLRTWPRKTGTIAGVDSAGRRVAVVDDSGRSMYARVWDVRRGRDIARHTITGGDIAISPDGRSVMLPADGRLWDVDRDRTVSLGAKSERGVGAFSPDGDWIATGTPGGAVVWDGASGKRLAAMKAGESQTRSIVLADGGRLFTGHDDGTVREWSIGARRLDGGGRMMAAAAVSRDGLLAAGLIAGGARAARPVVWDVATGRLRPGGGGRSVRRADPPPAAADLPVVAFTSTGQLIHRGRGRFQAVDTTTGSRARRIDPRVVALDAEAAQTLAFLAGRYSFRDVDGRATVADAPADARNLPPIAALSPDGQLAAIAGEGSVDLVETPRLRRRARLDYGTRDARPAALRFSRDSARLLAVVGSEVHVWSVAVGRRVVLAGHAGRVLSAEFGEDGRFVVTAGEDGVARVWNPATGALLVELPSSGAAALLPDNRALVTLGRGGPPLVRACDACGTWAQLVERIDARARRELTPAERARYVD